MDEGEGEGEERVLLIVVLHIYLYIHPKFRYHWNLVGTPVWWRAAKVCPANTCGMLACWRLHRPDTTDPPGFALVSSRYFNIYFGNKHGPI